MPQSQADHEHDLQLPVDPIDGLNLWLKEAEAKGLPEPTAMTLATIGFDGRPSARIVLYKGTSTNEQGRKCPRFVTNYESRKSREIEANPDVALVFHWTTMQRQIRVEGRAEKLSAAESDAYFQQRARGSQIGAWASPQSRIIPDRETLEKLVADTEKKFGEGPIPRPEFWGGWRVVPTAIEFWQGQTYRLHDRIRYIWSGSAWVTERLAP